jgi:hypothetical protein
MKKKSLNQNGHFYQCIISICSVVASKLKAWRLNSALDENMCAGSLESNPNPKISPAIGDWRLTEPLGRRRIIALASLLVGTGL